MEQSKKSAITRQKILDSAEAEFAQNGLAAARVDAIAKNAGVNKQLIYAHFQSKENLYSVILSEVYTRLSEYEKVLSESSFTGMETIRMIVMEYFKFLMDNPSFVRLMLWENLNGAAYVGDVKISLFAGAEKLLKQGVENGFLRKDLDIEQTAMSLNMFCFSAFSNIHTMSKLLGKDLSIQAELEKRADHIYEVLVKYILA
ncbi:MAG: TetR/AcrR family transcriptional regulator [Clostridia bacterium]|nr:TetR/AcrR family transcriptional regulator [Clostridia bacterium]MBQ4631106.1 TetR/AcrR family transcriptional regulator [Clostridia bacterium]